MNKYLKELNQKEDGVVLVTAMLFLMVVTLLAVTSLQSPKTDVLISGNQKFINQAQQLANIGIMEGKAWLEIHTEPDKIPFNVKVPIPNTNLFGLSLKGVSRDNLPGLGDPYPSNLENQITGIGKYNWKLIRVSSQGENFGIDDGYGAVGQEDFDNVFNNVASKTSSAMNLTTIDKFSDAGEAGQVFSDDIENGNAVLEHFYLFSEGYSGSDFSVTGYSEAIVSVVNATRHSAYK